MQPSLPELAPGARERLARLVRLLLHENRRVNLTGARSEDDLWSRHVADSLALLAVLPPGAGTRLLDLGSGGGLPGLPLACVRPDLHVTLLDATRKKVDAVRRIVAELNLANVAALVGRAETVAHDPAQRERYDVVTARAVAALPLLIEYAAGFLRVGGTAWFYKTARALETELAEATNAARICRLTYISARPHGQPGERGGCVLVAYRKDSSLDRGLPRAPGHAKKRPL
jgi:16S rRNA (guanine527-N7)-methyltransferase